MIEVSKYKDGKVAEHRAYMDATQMRKMMAAMQKPAGNDSSMKK
ncbi:MAG: hypothetical protein ABIO04_09180 [Ferruginibacter sp.]